jgi:hypothetical protein
VVDAGASPGISGALHVVAAARQALAGGHPALPWPVLKAWPAWALGADAPTRQRWAVLGLRWHARALRRSIDGTHWQAAEALLPRPVFQAALAVAADDERSGLGSGVCVLPPVDGFAEQVQATGRDIAVAALDPPALRTAVAAALGASPLELPAAAARAWLTWAHSLPVPPPLHEELPT